MILDKILIIITKLHSNHAKAIKVMKLLLGRFESGWISALRRQNSENSTVKQSSTTRVMKVAKS